MDLVRAGYDDVTVEQRDAIKMAYAHPPRPSF